MLRKAVNKAVPLLLAAVCAFSSVSFPVHAEDDPEKVSGPASEIFEMVQEDQENEDIQEDVSEQDQIRGQEVELDENRKIISLSQTVNGVKVTVRAKPGVLPEGTQLRVTPIEGVESLSLAGAVADHVLEEGGYADTSGS